MTRAPGSVVGALAVFLARLEGGRGRQRLPAVHPAAARDRRRPLRHGRGPTARSGRTSSTTLVEVALGFVRRGRVRRSSSATRSRAAPLVERLLSPYLVAAQATPILALAPLLALWFGPGLLEQGRDLLAHRVLPGRHRDDGRDPLGRRRGCSSSAEPPRDPAPDPDHARDPGRPADILGGLRVGVTLAVVGAIVGEWAGADRGLGVLINLARGSLFDIPLMFATLLTIALRRDRALPRRRRSSSAGWSAPDESSTRHARRSPCRPRSRSRSSSCSSLGAARRRVRERRRRLTATVASRHRPPVGRRRAIDGAVGHRPSRSSWSSGSATSRASSSRRSTSPTRTATTRTPASRSSSRTRSTRTSSRSSAQGAIDVGISRRDQRHPGGQPGHPDQVRGDDLRQVPLDRLRQGVVGDRDGRRPRRARSSASPGGTARRWIMLQALLASAGLTPDDLDDRRVPRLRPGRRGRAGRGRRRDRVRQQRAGPARADRRGGRRSCAIDDITPLPGPGLIAGVVDARGEARRDRRVRRGDPAGDGGDRRGPRGRARGGDHGGPGAGDAPARRRRPSWTRRSSRGPGPVQAGATASARIDPGGWTASIDVPDRARARARTRSPSTTCSDPGLLTRRRLTGRCSAGSDPAATRRSWWLREALAAEAAADPGSPTPPRRCAARSRPTSSILGGGYTGPVDRAARRRSSRPDARIVLLEADICGGGPSGRNGGFVTGWWDELPTLVERYGEAGALAIARAMDGAVDEIGRVVRRRTAWTPGTRRPGSLSVSAAPAQDGEWRRGRRGVPGARGGRPLRRADAADEVAARVALTGAPRRRVHAGRGDRPAGDPGPRPASGRSSSVASTIHEGTRASSSTASGRAGSAAVGAGRAASARRGRAGRPVRVRTTSAGGRRRGPRRLRGRRPQRLGGGVAVVRPPARDVVELHRADRADPGPPRRRSAGPAARASPTRGSRSTTCARPVTAGSPSAVAAAGPGSAAGSARRSPTTRAPASRAAAGLRRLFPSLRDVRIEDAWGGPIDISADHLPSFASLPGRPIHYAHGYSGNGVGPSLVAGRLLAGLGAGGARRATTPSLAPAALVGGRPRAFPPEPFRYLGARVVREAIVRREAAEERGERRVAGAARGHAAAAAAGLPPLARLSGVDVRGPADDRPDRRRMSPPPHALRARHGPCRSLR